HQVMQVGQRVPSHAGATGVAGRVIENRGAVGKVGTFQKDVEQQVAIEKEAHLQSVFGPQFFETGSALACQLAVPGPPGRKGRLTLTARRSVFDGLLQKIGNEPGKGGAPPLGRLLGPVVDRRIQGHGDTFFHSAYDTKMYVFCQPATSLFRGASVLASRTGGRSLLLSLVFRKTAEDTESTENWRKRLWYFDLCALCASFRLIVAVASSALGLRRYIQTSVVSAPSAVHVL
ncbi:MAG: hypothetical protein ACKOAL_13120, partial [Chthoniobacterales bacterium]